MPILKRLTDDEYPFTGIEERRKIARAMLLVDDSHFLFHHLFGDDIFGHRDYFETPGGGIEIGESPIEALKRECLEETGYEIEVLCELGTIIDHYNLIRRENINHYFLARAVGIKKDVHFVSKGDLFIKESVPLTLKEAKRLYLEKATEPLARLLRNRELPIIDECENVLLSPLFLAGAKEDK